MGLRPVNLWIPFQIQKEIELRQKSINLDSQLLPKQYIDGSIRVGGAIRCRVDYGTLEYRGGYGSIYRAKRILGDTSTEICIKIPHVSSFSLCPEAILQWMAEQSLESSGIRGAVPHIYDIFQYAGEVRMSMSFIEGVSLLDFILESASPERVFLQALLQISFLLAYLEETLHLDHRDLKGDNILIRLSPIEYTAKIGGVERKISAPFQVVLLDFGFSCLGEDGQAVVSLSDGLLPRVDPCPKEGRDLFQLIASLWSVPFFRKKMNPAIQKEIEELLSYKKKPYASLVKQTREISWIYLLVSDSEFKHPPLHPLSLFCSLSIKYKDMCINSG
jgi:serine/threonine protein kinase